MTAKHEPTDQTRRVAEQMSGLGLPHEQIGAIIGIDDKTLRLYYQTELKIGKAKASSHVAKTLYDKALSGDTTACIWWTKAQMQWREKVDLNHGGQENNPVKIESTLTPSEAYLKLIKGQ
jgi:hypothetical protein